MINNKNFIFNSEGWYWPVIDKADCCWKYLNDRKDVPKIISEYVKNKGVCVQSGGNAGFYVKQYAELFDTVYTFEPDSVNFDCLCLNLLDNPNVYKFQSFLGEEHKLFSIELSDNCGGHNLGKDPKAGKIPMLRIDDLNLTSCDLIQLDTEGAEIRCLLGGIETIKLFKPVIVVEIAWSDATDLLTQLGYDKLKEVDGDWIFLPT